MPSTSPHTRRSTPFSVRVDGVTVHRGDRPVLVDVNLTFTERSRTAIVGPNGIGKSTLLRVIAGRLTPDSGRVAITPGDATVGLLDQELQAPAGRTVRDLIADRLGVTAADAELAAASAALADDQPGDGDPAERYEQALQRYLTLGSADFDARLAEVADGLGLADHLLTADASTLSGGEGERVGLAMVMLSRFDLTLLDEPTNNLDRHGLDMLERWVDAHGGGLVLVSHDRAFLERAVDSVVEIDHHLHSVSVFNGGWEAYQTEQAIAAALAEERYQQYVDEKSRLAGRAQQQREWAAQGASRAKKRPDDNDKIVRNYRIEQTEKLVAKAKATERAIERLEVVDKPWQPWDLRFTIGQAPRGSDVVAVFDRAVLTHPGFSLGPFDLEVRWADRIALVGPNGSGKSTLLDAMLGRLAPTEGTVRLGPTVVVGELGQRRDQLTDDLGPNRATGGRDRTVLRAFQDASGLAVAEARSVLAKFGLDAEAVGRPAVSLSPGERTRAQLALFQARGVNLVVLDEPTNHLDLMAIEQLESALAGYDGTLILVTHDRRLLENVTITRTVDVAELG